MTQVGFRNDINGLRAWAVVAVVLYHFGVPGFGGGFVGVDVFIHERLLSPALLAERLTSVQTAELELKLITNRGVKVWPNGFPETFCTDHWRCRFMSKNDNIAINYNDIIRLLSQLSTAGLDVIKTENLCTFDGQQGFTLGQGQ